MAENKAMAAILILSISINSFNVQLNALKSGTYIFLGSVSLFSCSDRIMVAYVRPIFFGHLKKTLNWPNFSTKNPGSAPGLFEDYFCLVHLVLVGGSSYASLASIILGISRKPPRPTTSDFLHVFSRYVKPNLD